jgi:hypothetical protein
LDRMGIKKDLSGAELSFELQSERECLCRRINSTVTQENEITDCTWLRVQGCHLPNEG